MKSVPMRPRVTLPFLAAALALAFGVAPAQAHRLALEPLRPVALQSTAQVFAPNVRDAVIGTPASPAAARTVKARTASARFSTRDGISIPVDVSSAYKASASVEQGYVTFLGSLMHGPELRTLRVLHRLAQADPRQRSAGAARSPATRATTRRCTCRARAATATLRFQFLIAHEYGHHIELSRSNAPWDAYDTGPKNWFTYEQVCTRTRDRRVATNYWNDPSEGFAESYADSQYAGVPFPYSALMLPDQGAYRRSARTCSSPGPGPQRPLSGHAGPVGRRRRRASRSVTPLDGSVNFTLTPPTRPTTASRWCREARRSPAAHAVRPRIHALCGVRTLTVQVTRVTGSGQFRLTASLP